MRSGPTFLRSRASNENTTEAQARAELNALVRQWAELNPDTHVTSPDGHPLIV